MTSSPPIIRVSHISVSRDLRLWQFICIIPSFFLKKKSNHLVTSGASRLERFGVVSTAVETPFAVKVNQVDEQLATHAADETGRVPASRRTATRRHHRHVTATHRFAALKFADNLKINRIGRAFKSHQGDFRKKYLKI